MLVTSLQAPPVVGKRDPQKEATFFLLANLTLGNMSAFGYAFHSDSLVRYAAYLANQLNDPVEREKILLAVEGPA